MLSLKIQTLLNDMNTKQVISGIDPKRIDEIAKSGLSANIDFILNENEAVWFAIYSKQEKAKKELNEILNALDIIELENLNNQLKLSKVNSLEWKYGLLVFNVLSNKKN